MYFERADSRRISCISSSQSCGKIQTLCCSCTKPARFNIPRTWLRNTRYFSGMSNTTMRHRWSHRVSFRKRAAVERIAPPSISAPLSVRESFCPRSVMNFRSLSRSMANFLRYRNCACSRARLNIRRLERADRRNPYSKSPADRSSRTLRSIAPSRCLRFAIYPYIIRPSIRGMYEMWILKYVKYVQGGLSSGKKRASAESHRGTSMMRLCHSSRFSSYSCSSLSSARSSPWR